MKKHIEQDSMAVHSDYQNQQVKQKNVECEQEQKSMAIWDCGSPLYDASELVSLCHLIERNIMILPFSTNQSSSSVTDSVPVFKSQKEMNGRNSKTGFLRELSGIMFLKRKTSIREGKKMAKSMKTVLHKAFKWF
ncbi:hypothetical protein FRX31_034381 [Thalictrum thalictroides]|uniref:Uncharacterized protein n=1 Tax=Thalictrum thalictroides TaxID=46969 RepID=A0A7J6UUW2_THATH|nr:hypothetical protein FRX31_034381 [Thalictrum thalictroides]